MGSKIFSQKCCHFSIYLQNLTPSKNLGKVSYFHILRENNKIIDDYANKSCVRPQGQEIINQVFFPNPSLSSSFNSSLSFVHLILRKYHSLLSSFPLPFNFIISSYPSTMKAPSSMQICGHPRFRFSDYCAFQCPWYDGSFDSWAPQLAPPLLPLFTRLSSSLFQTLIYLS